MSDNLPPQRFAVGDRVLTNWGRATVRRARFRHQWLWWEYHVRHDFLATPENFGHWFRESELQPAPVEAEGAE